MGGGRQEGGIACWAAEGVWDSSAQGGSSFAGSAGGDVPGKGDVSRDASTSPAAKTRSGKPPRSPGKDKTREKPEPPEAAVPSGTTLISPSRTFPAVAPGGDSGVPGMAEITATPEGEWGDAGSDFQIQAGHGWTSMSFADGCGPSTRNP
ncbi:hypothetical protein T484DRAFT_1902014 [Baffinella frigidus]|nr:hypothetical protein T484DRAFT_1902014 [Cryptophyta sp. CCMP2293]